MTCEMKYFVKLLDFNILYFLLLMFFIYIFFFFFRSHGYVGSFIYCNIVQILFFIVFEFWDESYNWTPLHDT